MKTIKLCLTRVALYVALAALLVNCTTQPVDGRDHAPVSAPDELAFALRDISDYLNETIPAGSTIAILNIQSDSAALSEYIIDELIANAVNDRIFTVVDRQQLDLIRAEQGFQWDGEVDDNTALEVGRFLGAQTMISGRFISLGGRYRLTIRALNVQTAHVQGMYNRNIAAGPRIAALMAAGGVRPPAPVAAAPAGRPPAATGTAPAATGTAQPAPAVAPAAPAVVEPPVTGTMVPGDSLAEMIAWLNRSAQSHGTYILELRADETIAPGTNLNFPGGINITVVLRGYEENRTLRLSSHGIMFTVRQNVTFVLDNNITLHGHVGNTGRVVDVNGGTFRMRTGSVITGNTDGGVLVRRGSTFEMTGGNITNNSRGGRNLHGGGVHNDETFTMSGGTISGNTASGRGGGVHNNGTFTMSGGTISGNTASDRGGGVHTTWNMIMNEVTLGPSRFILRGGIITGNVAHEGGGGVSGPIDKTGGTITGHPSDPNNGNVVMDEGGNVWARRGHAVFISEGTRRENTAGPGVNLSSNPRTGAWEN